MLVLLSVSIWLRWTYAGSLSVNQFPVVVNGLTQRPSKYYKIHSYLKEVDVQIIQHGGRSQSNSMKC